MGRDFRNKGISGGHVRGLISAYIDGALSVAEQERVRAHVAACPECRDDYVELKAAQKMLRALPTEAAPRAFTLTREMVGSKSEPRPSFLARVLAPALAPRLATGSLLTFVLLLLVVVGDWGIARQGISPAVTALQANDQGASAYNATVPANNRKEMGSVIVPSAGGATSQDVPKAASMDTPTTGAAANTDMGNTQPSLATGVAPSTMSGAQATAGMMSNSAVGLEPTPISGATGGAAATAPTIGASGNSSPTTVALAMPDADAGSTEAQGQAQAAQPKQPNAQPEQAPATTKTPPTNTPSPLPTIETALGILALALAVAAAIAKYRVKS